jgi:hypothetical protein
VLLLLLVMLLLLLVMLLLLPLMPVIMWDVAARDNGVIIVLTGECAGICAVSNDAVVAWWVVLAHETNKGDPVGDGGASIFRKSTNWIV